MELCLILFTVLLAAGSKSHPVTDPVYPNTQYVSAQAIPIQYRQPQQTHAIVYQPQYVAAAAAQQQTGAQQSIYETPEKGAGLQKYSTQIKQPIQQVLLNTNVDRQVQRVATQAGGQLYLQQIQAAQQHGQAQEAIAAAQRKLTSQTLAARPQQQQHQQQQQQQQQVQLQYFREAPQQIKYARPIAQGYKQQARQQAEEQENPEDYDPNPSYKFGFDVNDDLYTNYQNRKEQREGNKITGSYSVVDSDGFVRTVTYTADPKEGFKAEVTRQPTDIVVKIPKPDPQFAKHPTQQQYIQAAQRKSQAQPQQPNIVYQYE